MKKRLLGILLIVSPLLVALIPFYSQGIACVQNNMIECLNRNQGVLSVVLFFVGTAVVWGWGLADFLKQFRRKPTVFISVGTCSAPWNEKVPNSIQFFAESISDTPISISLVKIRYKDTNRCFNFNSPPFPIVLKPYSTSTVTMQDHYVAEEQLPEPIVVELEFSFIDQDIHKAFFEIASPCDVQHKNVKWRIVGSKVIRI
ncbi:hypothetical protein KA517_03820 [Candidatus Gracilibacteria bacterium]|nr:hypothetical protein [Candidatus Gracilibacteria bacterium]